MVNRNFWLLQTGHLNLILGITPPACEMEIRRYHKLYTSKDISSVISIAKENFQQKNVSMKPVSAVKRAGSVLRLFRFY
ncbi:hypothetical protein EMIT091MI3_50022 [Kosakonia quasisacchari]